MTLNLCTKQSLFYHDQEDHHDQEDQRNSRFFPELKIYAWPSTVLHSKRNHVSSKMSRRRKWRIQKDYWDFLPNLANRFFHPGFIFFLYDMNYITSRIMTSIPFLICSSEKDNIVISTYSSSGLSEAIMYNMYGIVILKVWRATDNFRKNIFGPNLEKQ